MTRTKLDRPLPWLIASLVLFAIACATPAVYWEQHHGRQYWEFGVNLALLGWATIFEGKFAWFANPPLAIGWLLLGLRRPVGAALCSAIAILIALDTLRLFHTDVASINDHQRLVSLGIGFWAWLASMLVLFVGAIRIRLAHAAGGRMPSVPHEP